MVKKEQLIKQSLLIGVGMAAFAQEKFEKLAKELIRKGNLNKTEGKKLVKKIYQETEKTGKNISSVIESELKRLLKTVENEPTKKKTAKVKKKAKKTKK
ncbi:MAG: hypothetical protein ABH824_06270 [Nanoarchaeota archaeon]|nr:hypothetical protein [Nanoarchaeota archaeon]